MLNIYDPSLSYYSFLEPNMIPNLLCCIFLMFALQIPVELGSKLILLRGSGILRLLVLVKQLLWLQKS